jgi:hypothetical protein
VLDDIKRFFELHQQLRASAFMNDDEQHIEAYNDFLAWEQVTFVGVIVA